MSARLLSLLRSVWIMLAALTLLLLAARYVMLQTFAAEDLSAYAGDLRDLWRIGLRYDLRVASILLAPLFLLGLAAAARERLWRFFPRTGAALFALAGSIILFFSLANFYYYQTYHTYIDIFAFGFLHEDQAAILQNIREDYPVLRAVLGLLAGAYCFFRLGRALLRRQSRLSSHPALLCLYLCLSLLLWFYLARGGFGTFPLGRDDSRVSRLEILNKLTPNGVIVLDWARKDYAGNTRFPAVSAAEGQELLRRAGFTSFLEKTPQNAWLAANKPHVLLALLESFGSNMLALDAPPDNDLLGALRPHFMDDFLFRRFLPADNGTAPSLAALFFLSPAQNISDSAARHTALPHTPFRVYKEAGYRTVFIYPGKMMWRNLGGYLPLQGVDSLYDQSDLLRLYPEAEKDLTAWGAPDEYAWQLAEKLLREAREPLFISILSVSNHPPYRAPASYSAAPLRFSPASAPYFADGEPESLAMLKTFQYAADAFGRFLSRLKGSALGESTLVAATGDHQMRRLHTFAGEYALNLGVPFYLYLPEKLRAWNAPAYDPQRPGSHKDIFPTLFANSLSGAEYLHLGGRNMLAAQDDASRAFGCNASAWIDSRGVYVSGSEPLFHPWLEAGNKAGPLDFRDSLLAAPELKEAGAEQGLKMQAYPALLRWQINARVNGAPLPAPAGAD